MSVRDFIFYATATDADKNMVFGQLYSDPTPLVASTNAILAQMLAVKLDIKAAIEGLGIDLTGETFADYADVLDRTTLEIKP